MSYPKAFDVFLSYHAARDHAPVEAVARWLRDRGLTVFLDRWYLVGGRPWPEALEEALGACRAVAVFVGPGEMGPWQQREKYLALDRQAREATFPVIPVLLPRADPVLGFLGQNTWVDLRDRPDDPARLALLLAAIRGRAPGEGVDEALGATLATVSPYRGLLYFREEDAPFFFGREVTADLLLRAVSRRSLIGVVGASGSGKSSVVRAGLLPKLRAGRDQVWEMATLVPGDRPLYGLAAALVPLLEPDMTETARLIEIETQARALQMGDLKLRDIVERVLSKQPGTDRLLLVADQWEEVYTLTPAEASRRRFIDELLEASRTAPLSVVLTLRGDFVGQALAYRPLSDRLQDAQVNLGPMTRPELEQAIKAPAEKVGLRLEPGLVERILDDVGDEPGNLPLLEFVLKRLWEERHSSELRHAAYDSMGRLEGAIAKKAEDVFGELSPLEQDATRRVFLQLVRPGQGAEDTRRRARLADIGAASQPVVKRLADERLLVTAPGGAVAGETVEVSHEALIRHWARLKTWVNGDREFLLWRERFRGLLAGWLERGKDAGVLLPPALLTEAERWLAERGQREQGGQLSPEECEYIETSVERRRQDAEAERTRAARELANARALAETEAERARMAAEGAAAAEARALAQQRAKRWALISTLFFLALTIVLAYGPVRKELARWSLKRAVADDFVAIPLPKPDGKFPMGCVGDKDPDCGSDEKRHTATLGRQFDLMSHLVTVAQFKRYSNAQGSPPSRQPGASSDVSPYVNVAWDEARRFCEFVGGRLPTEAEWEWAARGGQQDRIYPWGDEKPSKEALERLLERRHEFGLHDMSGRVWQWTESLYAKDARPGPDDPTSDEARVVRGGSFVDGPRVLRASFRDNGSPDDRFNDLGFRCARDGSP